MADAGFDQRLADAAEIMSVPHSPPRPPVDMSAAYDRYHGTGYYARRYPAPNRHCLKLLKEIIAEAGPRVLDFGCGDGRYAAPLLHGAGARVLGYDVSHVAIEELSARCAEDVAAGRLQTVCGDLDDLARAAAPASFDVAVAMFGVLGHVPQRQGRLETLRAIRRLLRPGGRLVVTVPNARRRFRAEQAASQAAVAAGELEPGDVLYSREADGVHVDLYYHLYQPGELEAELRTAGFQPLVTAPESMLPERAVILSATARLLDGLLRTAAPSALAYGFLTVAAAPPMENA